MTRHRWLGILGIAWLAGYAAPADRSSGGLYTPERLANIRQNVERFDWARAFKPREKRG